MTVLAEIFGPDVSELIFCLYVVDVDPALLYQLLDEEIPQSHVLGSRVISLVAGDMSRCIVDIQRYLSKREPNPHV